MILNADPAGTHYGARGEMLSGDRIEHLQLEVLSLDAREAEPDYDGPPPRSIKMHGMSLDCGWLDDVPKAGKIVVEDSEEDVDWRKVLVRPVYYVAAANGPWERWNLGIYYVASAPGRRDPGGRRIRELQVYDTTKPLLDDSIGETYVLAAGTNVVEAVESILESVHIYRHSITPSDKTVRVTTSWPAATSKREIVDSLLRSINYTMLLMNWEGVIEARPERLVNRAGPVIELNDVKVEKGIGAYVQYEAKVDAFDTPNRWIGRSRAEGEVEPLVSVAENLDPESPSSYWAYGDDTVEGRWITRVTLDIEASDQDSLDSIVQGLLTRVTQEGQEYTVEHPLYRVDLRETMDFHNSEHGEHVRAVVTNMDLQARLPRAYCRSTVRERARL